MTCDHCNQPFPTEQCQKRRFVSDKDFNGRWEVWCCRCVRDFYLEHHIYEPTYIIRGGKKFQKRVLWQSEWCPCGHASV